MPKVPRLLPLAFLCLAGCSGAQEPDLALGEPSNWRQVATESDRARLRDWRNAWVEGLSEARAAGHAGELAREGALLDPDAALPDATLPPGDYRCRMTKLGSRAPSGGLSYVAYPAFRCRVTMQDGILRFDKLDGSQRQAGRLFEDTTRRMIFLGTLVLGDEQRPRDYGIDTERNLIGIVERIAPDRWRIAFPRPHFESDIDILELVPAR